MFTVIYLYTVCKGWEMCCLGKSTTWSTTVTLLLTDLAIYMIYVCSYHVGMLLNSEWSVNMGNCMLLIPLLTTDLECCWYLYWLLTWSVVDTFIDYWLGVLLIPLLTTDLEWYLTAQYLLPYIEGNNWEWNLATQTSLPYIEDKWVWRVSSSDWLPRLLHPHIQEK